jgi:hypothetical protein
MLSNVRVQHYAAAFVMLSQTVALTILCSDTPVYSSTYGVSSVWPSGDLDERRYGSLALHVIPPIFVGLAACTHIASAVTWTTYSQYVIEGRGWYCWVEFSLSASLMNLAIAALSGVATASELGSVFVFTSATMMFGAAAEWAASSDSMGFAKALFVGGCVPFLAAWTIVSVAFFTVASDAPGFVIAIFTVMFLAETTFAINTAVFLRRASVSHDQLAAHASTYETFKIILSLCSKTLLAWLLYGGIFVRAQ